MNPSNSVHVINVPTSIYPNYNYMATENAFLKQNIEYKDAVICEQQQTINNLKADVQQLSMANTSLKSDKDRFEVDAERWRVMKKIIAMQGGDKHARDVQAIVDKDVRKNGFAV